MLYVSGYINTCLRNTFDIVGYFFESLNKCFIPNKKENPTDFYNFSNLSKLEEVVIYEQPKRKVKRTKSDPNLRINFKENDCDWDIL